jgi:hypothetical protein
MPFVVKITGKGGTIAWLGAPNSAGLRTLAGRKSADIFQTSDDASVAIKELPPDFDKAGWSFSIESAD